MKHLVLAATALALAAIPALAQTPPPAAAPSGAATSTTAPPAARGALFRVQRPDLQLMVRCADGDTTRACGEIVAQMIEKLAAMPASRGGGERDTMRDGERDRSWDGERRDRRPRDRDY